MKTQSHGETKAGRWPEEIACADQVWLVAEWPDGTWCELREIREMGHMSDDYCIVRVLTHDAGYVPIKTERRRKSQQAEPVGLAESGAALPNI